MARLLIQSTVNGRFVVPDFGGVQLTHSLAEAISTGILSDYEEADQIIKDHLDRGYTVVDLDADYGE